MQVRITVIWIVVSAILLCSKSVHAQAVTIYDNFPPAGTTTSGWLVGTDTHFPTYQSVAAIFTTDSANYSSISITSLFFTSYRFSQAQYQSGLKFYLYEANGLILDNLISESSPIGVEMGYREPTELTWTLNSETTLKPNTSYWVRASASNPLSMYGWMRFNSPGTVALTSDDTNWSLYDVGSPFMRVTGYRDPSASVAPEPSSLSLTLSTLLAIAVLMFSRSSMRILHLRLRNVFSTQETNVPSV